MRRAVPMGELADSSDRPLLLNDEEFEVLEELLAKRRRAREENAILLETFEEHERRKTTCAEVDLNKLLATLEEQASLIAQLSASAEGLPRRVGWYRDKWQSGCTEFDLPWHRAIERWGEGHREGGRPLTRCATSPLDTPLALVLPLHWPEIAGENPVTML